METSSHSPKLPHRANGANVPPPMTSYNFEQRKWEMHDTFLRVMC